LANMPRDDQHKWIVALSVSKARQAVGMTQADLAETVRMSRAALARIELAQRSLPAHKALAIAEACDCSVQEVLTGIQGETA